MSFKASKFSQSSLEALLATVSSDKSDLRISAVDLRTTSGRFDLGADVKAEVSGRVRASGTMSYDPVSGEAAIRISEVKFGILNITGKVFDELKKQESEKLRVSRPFVYYKLK